MKIKTKLTLGVGLLFLLIIILSVLGIRYIYELKSDTENILTANYQSLQYSRFMLDALDNPTPEALSVFETNLSQQETNLTEIGEAEATVAVRKNFEQLKQQQKNYSILPHLRNGIYKIMDLNMQAIQRKSKVAETTSNRAVFWISISGSFCFLIAFTLLINLPSNIANPIHELTESIKQIAAENYAERVHFKSGSEFGQLAVSFNTMAEKLEEYNNSNLAKLMIEKKRIETLINNMQDPVIGLDENLNIIFANEVSVRIIGLTHNTLVGHNAKDLALKNDLIRTLIQDIMIISECDNKSKPIKIYADNKEGYFEKETLHIEILPTGEKEKKLIGHVIVLRNVTEYKELDFAKTNFIATVSHELKTPISSIKMSLQLLENNKIGALNNEQSNLVLSIKDDANRLLKITGELLNMTQVETGNIQLSILPSNPKEILQYALNATKTQAEQKQITLELSEPTSTPLILADTEKTAWVLTNLISNAIRYSYDNSRISVSLLQVNDTIHFSVKDTGQGIAPQYKDKVFDRYFRVPGTKKEGTGLGLAISKEFIEAQGGQILVESEFGSGSTFTVILNTIDHSFKKTDPNES